MGLLCGPLAFAPVSLAVCSALLELSSRDGERLWENLKQRGIVRALCALLLLYPQTQVIVMAAGVLHMAVSQSVDCRDQLRESRGAELLGSVLVTHRDAAGSEALQRVLATLQEASAPKTNRLASATTPIGLLVSCGVDDSGNNPLRAARVIRMSTSVQSREEV